MRKHFVGLRRVAHVLLDAEIVHADVEMQSGAHADGAEIGGAVGAGSNLIDFGEARDFLQMRDAAGVNDCRSNVVDELLFDELLAIEDRC